MLPKRQKRRDQVIIRISGTGTGVYNLQGDVIALVDSTGAKVVEYSYDARANHQ